MADMKIFAERLAKAMPERFELHAYQHGLWVLEDKTTGFSGCQLISNSNANGDWAFWGPLWEELNPAYFGYGTTWLEAIAESVCQEAERRVEKKQG